MLADKSGRVKEDAFFTILGLHGVALDQASQSKVKSKFSRAGLIDYKLALQILNIDLESAMLNEE